MKSAFQLHEKSEPFTKDDFETLLEMVKSVKYGSVTLIIQDGKAIQIDKNEKVRLR